MLNAQPYTYLPLSGFAYRLRQTFDILLTFALIFTFPCFYFWRSSMVTCGFLALVVLLSRAINAEVIQFALSPYFRRVMIVLLLNMAYAYVCTKTYVAEEYEQVRACFVLVLYLPVTLCMYIYLRRRHGVEGVLKIIFYAFVLQSVVQMLGYASSECLRIIRIISPEDMNAPGAHIAYIQHRGFAMAGVKYFGLSVAYSFVMIYYVFLRNRRLDFGWRDGLLLVIFSAGACFTARSFFLGIAASLGLLLLCGRFGSLVKIFGGTFSAIFAATLLFSDTLKTRMQSDLFPWLFEAWYTFKESGKIETRSSKILLDGHYRPITTKQFFFGDGIYVMPDGQPYYDTDAGYLRVILFGGLPYLFLRMLLLLVVIWPLFKMRRSNAKTAFLSIIVLTLFFQIKGDILTGLTMLFVCLFFLTLVVVEIDKDGSARLKPLPPPQRFGEPPPDFIPPHAQRF